jgi:hypothetical protein
MKKMRLIAFLMVILIGYTLGISSNLQMARGDSSPSTFKISGYILDSKGKGVAGAEIIFNVPSIVPSVYSDYSGYYEISAPAGTYHINVWPPYDSNFIYYDQPSFAVGADMSKNITLLTGYKVSGYVTDSNGTPVTGAVVLLNNFGSGWFSNYMGYYFLSVPAGTYTINAHPRTGYNYSSPTTNFPTYYEYNFIVNSNTIKNITVGSPTPTATPPTSTPTPIPTQNPTPTPVPTPILPSTLISISTDASSYQVGSTLNVKGRLSDQNGATLNNKTVILSYSVADSPSWYQIGSDKTNTQGEYNIQWVILASGTFNIKVEWAGDTNNGGAENSTTFSFLPYQKQNVFCVESNSTVTGLAFNSTSFTLDFAVSGPTGTTGYTKVTIAKTLAPNFTGITVLLDGKELNSTVLSSNDYWIVTFIYHHSTHQVTINLSNNAKGSTNPTTQVPELRLFLAVVFVVVLTAVAFVFVRRRLISSPKASLN